MRAFSEVGTPNEGCEISLHDSIVIVNQIGVVEEVIAAGVPGSNTDTGNVTEDTASREEGLIETEDIRNTWNRRGTERSHPEQLRDSHAASR